MAFLHCHVAREGNAQIPCNHDLVTSLCHHDLVTSTKQGSLSRNLVASQHSRLAFADPLQTLLFLLLVLEIEIILFFFALTDADLIHGVCYTHTYHKIIVTHDVENVIPQPRVLSIEVSVWRGL